MNNKEFKKTLREWLNINERTLPNFSHVFKKESKAYFIPYDANFDIDLTKLKKDFKSFGINIKYENNIRTDNICLNKDLESYNAIKNIMHDKYKLIDSQDLGLLKDAVSSNLPVFISFSRGNFLDDSDDYDDFEYENDDLEDFSSPKLKSQSIEEIKKNIPWALHDLYHNYFEGDYLQDITSIEEESYKDIFPNQTAGSEMNLPKEKILDELSMYFNKINYTNGINSNDVIASLWSYCITEVKDITDIQSLDIEENCKNYMCSFYENAMTKFDEILLKPAIISTIFITYI